LRSGSRRIGEDRPHRRIDRTNFGALQQSATHEQADDNLRWSVSRALKMRGGNFATRA